MRKSICIFTACAIIITILTGCGALKKLGLGGKDNDELYPVSSIVINEEDAKRLSDKIPVHLYFANEDNTRLKKEIRYIEVGEAKKGTSTLASWIVKELIKGPKTNKALKPTIPEGTELRSPVVIEDGIATVDLTNNFVNKHPGGKEAEQMTIFSIVNSLTELKEIQKVRFLINGKKKNEFKGNFQFDAPFPRTPALIDKDTEVPATIVPNTEGDDTAEGLDLIDEDAENVSGEMDNPENIYIDLLE